MEREGYEGTDACKSLFCYIRLVIAAMHQFLLDKIRAPTNYNDLSSLSESNLRCIVIPIPVLSFHIMTLGHSYCVCYSLEGHT